MRRRHLILCALAVTAVGLGGLRAAQAADHLDPNDRVSPGDAADIGDLYAWHDGGDITAILTFAGPVAAGVTAAYSRDTLYAIHIDGDDSDVEPDQTIYVRFGQDSAGTWGVQAQNVPGTSDDLSGAVGSTLSEGSSRVYAGMHDDPFFFDSQGLTDTLATGTLSFVGTRDFFADQNINAIVVEFPESALGLTGPYNIWATSANIGGTP